MLVCLLSVACQADREQAKYTQKIQRLLELQGDDTKISHQGNCDCIVEGSYLYEGIQRVHWEFNWKNVTDLYLPEEGGVNMEITPSRMINLLEFTIPFTTKEKDLFEKKMETKSVLLLGNLNTTAVNKEIYQQVKLLAKECGATFTEDHPAWSNSKPD